ncbi:MAG: Glu-tRNA(Gln) amidotransferase subunit GatE [Candidatus Krumholzibacteria bacterium]|nr:Glu-tRNA(Gln) amidotransferase subunit GatE [Candidatus Krumholzibacteria bacterium]
MAVFKPFDEMTPADYAEVGLRAGLEVHQQLFTRRKLFCRCPAGRYSPDYDAEILRHMRPTLSELGEYDGTALMEFKTRKDIVYRLHRDTVCTYEMDDTPPFTMDPEALDIAVEIAMLLNLNRVDELHIARKQYLDGSIPTGFQRTTIVGVDGWIPYGGRRIRIAQLGLEEDSCREVSDAGHERVYLTDRLGMPLVEPVTYPDMHTPQEVAEVGEILRRLLRATGKVRTGMGATRQDVNVSVEGSTRIEIKGVPSLKRIPLLVHNEAMRQWNLLRIRGILHARGVTPETFAASTQDVTRLLAPTTYEPLRKVLAAGGEVRCVRLHGFAGILIEKTQPDTIFAKEVSDRVRVIACLTVLPNMAHSDAPSDTLSAQDWRQLRQATGAGAEDALVVVWGPRRDAETAASEVTIRAREAAEGVPRETRQALRDGTTGFERILPGPERMYPDTDLPPIALAQERVERIRRGVPEPPWSREARYAAAGLPEDVVAALSLGPPAALFDRVVGEGTEAGVAAQLLVQRMRAWRRRGLPVVRMDEEAVAGVFAAHARGRVAREGIEPTLHWLADREESGVEGALRALGFTPLGAGEARAEVEAEVAAFAPGSMRRPEKTQAFLMGRLMARLRGRVPGSDVAEMLRAALGARGTDARSGREARGG